MNTIRDHEDVLKQIRKAEHFPQHVKLPDNKQYLMDAGTAKLLLQIQSHLTSETAISKFNRMLCTSTGLMRLVDFAWKHASFS